MSAGNRVKLCNGLAKRGILGKKFFQRVFPRVKSVKISSPAFFSIQGGNINTEIHFGNDTDSMVATDPNLKAGDTLVMQALKGCYDHDHHVNFEFSMTNGAVIYCQGFVSNWTDDSQNNDEFIYILVPQSNGYFYTQAIAERFNIPKKNENVGVYPNCRAW